MLHVLEALLCAHKFIIVINFPFIIMKCSSLSLVILFVLKFLLSDIKVASSVFLRFLFTLYNRSFNNCLHCTASPWITLFCSISFSYNIDEMLWKFNSHLLVLLCVILLKVTEPINNIKSGLTVYCLPSVYFQFICVFIFYVSVLYTCRQHVLGSCCFTLSMNLCLLTGVYIDH